jgi:hypothetical protein
MIIDTIEDLISYLESNLNDLTDRQVIELINTSTGLRTIMADSKENYLNALKYHYVNFWHLKNKPLFLFSKQVEFNINDVFKTI